MPKQIWVAYDPTTKAILSTSYTAALEEQAIDKGDPVLFRVPDKSVDFNKYPEPKDFHSAFKMKAGLADVELI